MAKTDETKELVPAPPVPLWERQGGESNRAFAAFVVYRDLPSTHRMLRAVRDVMYPDSPWADRTIAGWATRHRWEDRVIAWENELDRMKRDVQIETLRTMAARHIRQAIALQEKGFEALTKLNLTLLDAADVRLLIVEGAKLERLSRGESTEKVEQGGASGLPDLSGYTDEELRRLEDTASRLAEGTGKETP